jgi:ankyrin repeat protein
MRAFRVFATCLFVIGAPILATIARATTFPPIDYSKLQISLQRSACLGFCPDYLVTISGDGSVTFTTDYRPGDPVAGIHREFSRSTGVLVPGTHHIKIDPETVKRLTQQFREARFFDLKNEYRYGATDAPTYIVSIETGHGSKRIVDYIGREAGMPPSVTSLEDSIDKAAKTELWIKGTPEVIPFLQQEGFRFSSPAGLELMTAAADRDDVVMMEQLQKLGTPPGGSHALQTAAFDNRMKAFAWLLDHGAGDDRKVLLYALGSAAAGDNDQAFDRLRELLGPGSITPDLATKLLRQAAENGNARMVSHLLQFHPRLTGSVDDRPLDDPPLWAAAQHSCPDEGSHPNCDHRKVVRMLLDAGSDPKWFNPIDRNSVFFQVSDPEIAKMLLARGADPNFKDTDGEPIIFSIDNEDVALVMINAGLNLRSVRPGDKMTLRGWATYEKWPRVLALLDKAGLLKSHDR